MPRERTLAAGAALVVAAALLVAAAVPGVVAEPSEDRPERPGRVDVAEVAIAPGQVSGGTAELVLRTRLVHRGPATPNVTVRFRAIDAQSGLIETERSVDLGTVDADGEVPVNATLRVEREGGYRIEMVVFRGNDRVATSTTGVRGLSALTPEYARTNVEFTSSDVLPPIAPSVVEAGENRTTLEIATSLTNRGDNVSADLSVRLVLRQADSNLVAAERTVAVDRIRPGRTASVAAELTVPSGYNYYVDAVLLADGVVVDTARGVVNLDPTETIRANETRRDVELEVSDFEREAERPAETPRATGTPAPAGAQSPGFGAAVALVALLAVTLLARRWSP